MALQSFAKAYKNDNQPFIVSIDGKDYEGFFANIRVDKKTLPQGWYAYDLREEEGEICELKNGYVLVNHFGTFCTQNVLLFCFFWKEGILWNLLIARNLTKFLRKPNSKSYYRNLT